MCCAWLISCMFVPYLTGLSCHDMWKDPNTKQGPEAEAGQPSLMSGGCPQHPLPILHWPTHSRRLTIDSQQVHSSPPADSASQNVSCRNLLGSLLVYSIGHVAAPQVIPTSPTSKVYAKWTPKTSINKAHCP